MSLRTLRLSGRSHFGMDFERYCKMHIFTPLGMKETGWKLADIDTRKHAVPYTYISDDFKMPEEMTSNHSCPDTERTDNP